MTQKACIKEIDIASFEEKVYVIADELLGILKELSRENQKQINCKLIAEKMSQRETVKSALAHNPAATSDTDIVQLREIANTVIEKFSEMVPSHITENLSVFKDALDRKGISGNATDWLDSPLDILKKYIASISGRNKELEEFMKQTISHLSAIERPLASELSSQKQKFTEDRKFEEDLNKYMSTMKDECNAFTDITAIKTAFMGKIENISKGFEKKREKDILRLKETEKTLEDMSKRMNEVKHEAEEIRKRSQEIEIEVYRDALTGLHNRKAYDERMTETLANAERYDLIASLMVCDIDFFKKINDTFGHKVGDLALKKLADFLRERLRKNDFISRYGGEEFVIILPHTDISGAIIAGEGIRSYIARSVFSYKSREIPLTISVGISSFKKGDTVTSVFERADQALYLAKKSGRNAVKTENDIVVEPS
ncbi:MAG: GGDEF domain-containing protein [Nitrospirae bacterium]|nr:GGDEF domain-containing protein [Nitrospirota bacterium]